MPPRGLKMRNRGVFDMYMFIYRKKTAERNINDNLSILLSQKDSCKDALCDYVKYKNDKKLSENDLDTLELFRKALATLTLNEAIQLMYLMYGDDQILLDMFDNVRRVNFGQFSEDSDNSEAF